MDAMKVAEHTMRVTLDIILDNAAKVVREKSLPNHNAFTISEVVGAVTGLSKEVVMDEMLRRNSF